MACRREKMEEVGRMEDRRKRAWTGEERASWQARSCMARHASGLASRAYALHCTDLDGSAAARACTEAKALQPVLHCPTWVACVGNTL